MTAEEFDWASLLAIADGRLAPPRLPGYSEPPDLRDLDYVKVVEHFGSILTKEFPWFWSGFCPFCSDFDDQSFYVRAEGREQACGCYRCDFGHDRKIVDFVMWATRGDSRSATREALALLAARDFRLSPSDHDGRCEP